MATLEEYFFTNRSIKLAKWFLWGALALIVALLIFHAGVIAGSRSRMPAGRPSGGYEAELPFGGGQVLLPQGFMPGNHGALGTITTITLPSLTLTTRDGTILTVDISGDTQIVGATPEGTSSAAALSVGETVIVVGDPDNATSSGAMDARFIRIFPN